MKNIVKYSNQLNILGIQSMSKLENNVFFALIHKLENQHSKAIELSLVELKALIGVSHQTNSYIQKTIENLAQKFSRFSVKYKDDKEKRFFSVFEVLTIPNEEPIIKAKLSNQFQHLLNDVNSEFTFFDLAIYTSFSSKYTQTLYRLLKQFNSTGYYKTSIEDFRKNLDVKPSYQLINIDKRILEQAKIEFKARNIFKNLTIQKIKSATRGKKITHIEFIFTPETKSNYEKLQEQEKTTIKDTKYAESVANRQQILENQKAKQQIKQHNIAALAAGCNALKVDEPIEEREDRIKKEVQRMNMSNIMKAYAGRWFTYNNTSYKIDNFEFNNAGKLVLFIRLEDNTPARYMHEFESINHFENYVKDYLI